MTPERRGVAKNLTLKHEAVAIIERRGGKRGQGDYVSRLVLQDEDREIDRERWRQRVDAAFHEDVP